jgi:hypothetical protein
MGAQPNPFIGVNYLDIDSRMAAPPAYWLQRLYDRDADLVVFPSIQTPFAYVLARRAHRTGGMNAQDPTFANAPPDTKFCIERHLLPICLIYRYNAASWSIDNIIAELDARDIWKAGGGDAYADQADAADAKREQQNKQSIRDDMWNRSSDAWGSYASRAGLRTKTHYGHRSTQKA